MRDLFRRRRAFGTLAATAGIALLVSTPAALAQTDPTTPPTTTPPDESWAGSTLDGPLAAGSATFAVTAIPVSGVFVKDRAVPAGGPRDKLLNVSVTFSRLDEGPGGASCAPGAPTVTTTETSPSPTNPQTRSQFSVDFGTFRWACNGTYEVVATGADRRTSTDLRAKINVAVPPRPVAAVDATVSNEKRTVTVTWDETEDPEIGFLGYRIERAGPKDGDSFGAFAPVGDDVDADTSSITDTLDEPGDYRYRVSTLRYARNAGGAKISLASLDKTAVDVTLAEKRSAPNEPAQAAQPPSIPSLGASTGSPSKSPRPRTGANRPGAPNIPSLSTPTTTDTGFDEELDYSHIPLDEREPGELAGEGQAIIRNEGGGAGLVGPVAGALVLLGWAGHVTYLNRLAKQF